MRKTITATSNSLRVKIYLKKQKNPSSLLIIVIVNEKNPQYLFKIILLYLIKLVNIILILGDAFKEYSRMIIDVYFVKIIF